MVGETHATPCTFCGGVVGAGDTPATLHLHDPLPHSLLSVSVLLQYLGMAPQAGTLGSQATLCCECQALLHEGDKAYHNLLQVTASMRRRWPQVLPGPAAAATSQSDRRLRPILPKSLLSQDSVTLCELCGARPREWQTHAAIHHRLPPRWRNPELVVTLKALIKKEVSPTGGWKGVGHCPACPDTFSDPGDLMNHLTQHHRVGVQHSQPVCVERDAVEGQDETGQQQGAEEAVGLVKEQVLLGKEEETEDRVMVEVKDKEESVQKESTRDVEAEDRHVMKEEEEEEKGTQCDRTVEGECVLREGVVEEQNKVGRGNIEGQQEIGPSQHMCPRRSGGGAGRGHASQWRCRVCAAIFTSQQDHDLHKAAAHPGSVRARRGKTQPALPPSTPQEAAGDHHDAEQPMAATQEGAIIIMEGDMHGGVMNCHLQSPEDTLSQPGSAEGLVCGTCGEVLEDRPALLRHRQTAHPGVGDAGDRESKVLLECPLCGRRVFGLPALRLHQARTHPRPTHSLPHHCCRLCPAQCHTRAQLERHMQERHGAPPPPPPVRCDQCGKTYSARYIDAHVANMHGDARCFSCTFCPMRFGGRDSLRTHVSREHANTSWRCQECQLQFTKYHQLRQHWLYVHSRAEHRCPECPRSFKRRCDLTEHTKRRHQERPARECSFCPKVYCDRKRLRMHLMRKHSVAWEDTLAQSYARRQRENNCLRRRQQQQQQPRSPRLSYRQQKQQQQQQPAEGVGREAVAVLGEDQPEYSVVELSEAPHPLTDTISYIILEEVKTPPS